MSNRAKSILARAAKTMVETALGYLVTYATIWDVDFKAGAGIIAISTICSLLYNIAAELPEDRYQKEIEQLRAANDALRGK